MVEFPYTSENWDLLSELKFKVFLKFLYNFHIFKGIIVNFAVLLEQNMCVG